MPRVSKLSVKICHRDLVGMPFFVVPAAERNLFPINQKLWMDSAPAFDAPSLGDFVQRGGRPLPPFDEVGFSGASRCLGSRSPGLSIAIGPSYASRV